MNKHENYKFSCYWQPTVLLLSTAYSNLKIKSSTYITNNNNRIKQEQGGKFYSISETFFTAITFHILLHIS